MGSEGGCPQYIGQQSTGGAYFQFPTDVSDCTMVATTEPESDGTYAEAAAAVTRNRGVPASGKIIGVAAVYNGTAIGNLSFDVAVYCS